MGKGIISGADVAIQLVDLREEQTWNRLGGAECERFKSTVKVTGSESVGKQSIIKGVIFKFVPGTVLVLGGISVVEYLVLVLASREWITGTTGGSLN